MKNFILKLFFFIILLPIRVSVLMINVLRRLINSEYINENIYFFRTKISNEISKVLDETYIRRTINNTNVKLNYVDIGARDGLPELIENNLELFEQIVLCEGEPNEAEKLKRQGFLVIDQFLSDKEGVATFFFNSRHPGASSLNRPGTPFLDLFSNKHYEIYTNFIEQNVRTSTLDIEMAKLEIQNIDYIKIDVQGSELPVIKGLKSIKPLFWEVEVLQLPTYQNIPYGVEISNELVNRGYVCFRKKEKKYADGIFIFSNELYMPDYTKEAGMKLIKQNFDRWRLLIELFDINKIGKNIEKRIQ